MREGADRRELTRARLAGSERIFHVLITPFREEEGQRAALLVAEDGSCGWDDGTSRGVFRRVVTTREYNRQKQLEELGELGELE